MNCTFDLGGTYIPKWRKNNKLPGAEQIVVEWEYPTTIERSQFQFFTPFKVGVDGEFENTIEYKIDNNKIVSTCVKKIKNLNVNGKAVTNGDELLQIRGLYGLADELSSYLLPKLREIDEKN